MRKELVDGRRFATIEQAQTELDAWVDHYNLEREHQAIGDVAPIRRFELVERAPAEVLDPDNTTEEAPPPTAHTVGRRVDRARRISILSQRVSGRKGRSRSAGYGMRSAERVVTLRRGALPAGRSMGSWFDALW